MKAEIGNAIRKIGAGFLAFMCIVTLVPISAFGLEENGAEVIEIINEYGEEEEEYEEG